MSKLEQALEDCLARLASGEAIEACLARYPEHAAELRRLLATAGKLENGRVALPAAAFKTRARAQLLAHMQAQPRQPQAKPRVAWRPRRFGLVFGRAFNFASGAAAVLLLFLATGTVLAQTALPGDALYGWKVTSEQVWRAVHLNPLNADLLVAARRAQELINVAGNPQAEPLARQGYQQSLTTLTGYTSPESQEIISATLLDQKGQLAQAGVPVPELDRLLSTINVKEVALQLDNQLVAVENGLITYTLTITNIGPDSPVSATIINALSPAEKLVSTGDAACQASADGRVTCTVDNLIAETPRHLQLTTAVDPCYAGDIGNTASIADTGNIVNTQPDQEVVAASTISVPFPHNAQIAYVQSNAHSHSLGLVTANNELINGNLHMRAAAPTWSPVGTKLAFFGEEGISELAGIYSRGNGLWLVDIIAGQARNPKQLLALDHIKNIAWSPDGTKLAFEVWPPGSPHEIRVVKASNGEQISRFPGEQPTWSPDSQKLVIKNCTLDCGLWQVNFNGRNSQQITFGDTDSYPAWSPTGQYLAFSSHRQGNWEIYLLRLADKALLRLTQRSRTDTTPVFGPCSQEIYLRTDAFGSWWITAMKLDGSDERKVQEGVGPSNDWGLARPAVKIESAQEER
ncbi:MAG TPA: hypothetical protein VEC96_01985 [Anaerolineae bacterium]|nr:hypothetical protein [Anaerolineae bacterium]